MKEYPTYPSFTNADAFWMGPIPQHWEVQRIGAVFSERREKVSDKDFKPLSVTKNGVVPQLETAAKTNDGDNRKGVRKGDFVINSRSDRKGSSGIAKEDGSVSLINIVLQPFSINPAYSEYLFKSSQFIDEFYRNGHGIVDDLWTTRFVDMKGIQIPIPPEPEQTAIARFLDKKTGDIQRFIALKEHTISLLKERKKGIINQAITKGLNPNANTTDSGIDWLGKIPAHWEIKKFSREVYYQEGPGIMAVDFKERGVPLIRIAGVQDDFVTLKGCNYLDPIKVKRKWNHFKLNINDLLISCSASTDLISEVDENAEGCIPYTGLIRLQPRRNTLIKEYLKYFIKSAVYTEQVELLKAGSAMQHYGPSHIRRFFIVLPSRDEQEAIVAFLNGECSVLEASIAFEEEKIAVMKEYRESLISEAVTGKIDVRKYPQTIR